MHETTDDRAALQRLLDASDAAGGSHLTSIISADRRLDADALCDLLQGVCVLTLATVTADCRPLAAPVDGLFFRGAFHFGSSPDSVRFRHLAARPQVSATHVRGEELAVIVHGTATRLDLTSPDAAPFRDYIHEVHPDWDDWGAGAPYARIEARRMDTYRNAT